MALDPDKVIIGTARNDGLYVGASGVVTEPADANAALTGYTSVGYLSDDPITLAVDISKETISAWQTLSPLREVITGRTLTMEFTCQEVNETSLSLYFDQTISDADDVEIASTPGGKLWSVVIDLLDGTTKRRFVFPRASLSSAGDIEIGKGAPIALPVTLTALDDNGVLGYSYGA